ncbi:MAG TPA: 23S rRNA (adenine(2503)-C(2))-methyltransferase RlmN [Vicinamibacterales bacterium]|nr:23S rRNA (adenine(2503)-C(2))-methyltransferase RlmN [Vicinamibacterales bacterium]
MEKVDLAGLELKELEEFVQTLGHKKFHARQIYRWIWKHGVSDFSQMTDLSRELRAALVEKATVSLPRVIHHGVSEDGTQKYALQLADGKQIESVFIPDTPKQTFCISTQVGCAMGCAFCLTGKMGLVRHLTAAEIAGQVRLLARSLHLLDKPFNIVLMGMGEPLQNYDATMKALRIINEKEGLDVHPKRVTLSTVGLVPAMDKLAQEELMPNLAVSLHAPTEEQRRAIVPPTKKYSLNDIIDACKRFPLSKRRRIMFEYVMLKGINDSDADARNLVKVLSGVKAKVNLLPLNEAAGIPFERPSDERVNKFAKILADKGLMVSVRKSRGRDIRAACGQLIVEGQAVRKSAGQKLASAMVALLMIAGCAQEPDNFRDFHDYIDDVPADQREAAIEKFITSKGGTPIIENQTRLVFFAKDKDGLTPRIVGDFNGWALTQHGYDVSIGKPIRIEGTDWSYLESKSYTNARLEYVFFFDKEAATDPKNPRTVPAYAGPRSEVRMPFWVAQPEVDEAGTAPKGEVIAHTVTSRFLGGPRRVWFYVPPGYGADSSTLYPVMYVLDGSNYVEKMDVPRILDHLIANTSIPPVIAVFVEPGERQEEYSRNPRWRAFIANELVPMVDKRFRTYSAPDHRVILGSSLAAYGAVDLAVEYPSLFGLCAAIAPPAQTYSLVENQAKARASVVSIKFFVLGGVYDSMIDGARKLRTTLDDYSAPVRYLEVSEGHNTNTFRGHLDDALKALLVVGS